MQVCFLKSKQKGNNAPLIECHDRWSLVFEDGFIRVDANVELVAELAGLNDCPRMS